MAYSDYGAFVYKNRERQKHLEDCLYDYKDGRGERTVHGLITDGKLDIICYKQGLPKIFINGNEVDYSEYAFAAGWNGEQFDYDPFCIIVEGYRISFANFDKPYVVEAEINGDVWRCEYDYWYGAGFED